MKAGKITTAFKASNSGSKPTKPPSPVTLRLTQSEKDKLIELAQGMSMSAYIRACVFNDQAEKRKRVLRTPVKDKTYLAELLGLLGQSRIANNLNQLAFNANTGSLEVDDITLSQIEEAYSAVREMRGLLVKSLGLRE